ncbi:MAG TPA: MBL fold metallo-hydrolase [Saprospiraceae bacterium]|nr:MBL fold metallo-hydrolase [Saprospiraceae bacterium]
MIVEQLFTGCLAEMAYFIADKGEAAIIDPLRETKPYLELLKKHRVKLKYIFLTHFHADFVSGQVDLAKATGATIVFGPNAKPEYKIKNAKDGEIFPLGDIKLKVLHTPGHTMESISIVLIDKKGKEKYVFSGDALFIGDVGRPDLAVKSDLTQADLAGHLYNSLRKKIMTLPDDIVVYPNHGAGSACGKNMSKETWDTLGHQKEVNYALRADMTKDEFIKEVTTGLKTPPQYFPKNVGMNKSVNKSIDEVVAHGMRPLSAREFKVLAEEKDVLVIDTRSKRSFTKEFIPGSWYFGIDGSFATWIGTLIKDLNQKIIFLAPRGREEEVVTRLARVGYDNALGYLKGGIRSWKAAGFKTANFDSTSAAEFAEKKGKKNLVDVRKESEYYSEHVIGAENVPLNVLPDNIAKFSPSKSYNIYCASGYRSLIACSILYANGIKKITDIRGGFKALKRTDIKVSDYVCPTTML